MLIIYNIKTGHVVENQGTNSIFPNGVPDASPIMQHLIERLGGSEEEYGILRLHDINDAEVVDKTSTHAYTIQKERVVFGEELEIDDTPSVTPEEKDFASQLDALEKRINTASQTYDNLDKNESITPIEELRTARILKLKEECSNSIYDGFVSGAYFFGFNENDQANFTQQLIMIIAGQSTNIQWKTKNAGVQTFTPIQFQGVVGDAKDHKVENQRKYWMLEAQVLTCLTNKEIDAVKW